MAESYQTVLNVLKVQKPTKAGSDSDEKIDIAIGSRVLQTIEEDHSDDCDEEDDLPRAISVRLGMPNTRASTIEDLNSLFTGLGHLDSKVDESLESPALRNIRSDLLEQFTDEKERAQSIKSIKSFGSTQRSISLNKVQVLLTPKRKSIRITEAVSIDKRRISLRLSKKLVLKQGDPRDFYNLDKEVLGKGTFGKVKRAVNISTKEEVAIKRIKKKKLNEANRALLENEIRILQQIKHKRIVGLFDVYETKKSICLIMELCSGGDVFDLVDKEQYLDEVRASALMQQIVEAVDYIHGRGVVHRDLKLENILIVNKKLVSKETPVIVKIADFGFATTIKTQDALIQGTCGSLNYVAPEVLSAQPYTKACDLWSLGVILYAMLGGYLPFYEEDIGGRAKTFQKIKQGIYDFDDPVWFLVSDLAKSVIKGLLTVKVAARLKCKELAKHQWLRSHPDTAIKSVC